MKKILFTGFMASILTIAGAYAVTGDPEGSKLTTKNYVDDAAIWAAGQGTGAVSTLQTGLANGTIVVSKATSADSATNATNAENATNAGYATAAGKATNDEDGVNIAQFYAKKADIAGDAKAAITGTSPIDVTNGVVSVESTHAIPTSAATAKLEAISASADELDILDGATVSTTELNYVKGVTSGIQEQLNGKIGLDAVKGTAADYITVSGGVVGVEATHEIPLKTKTAVLNEVTASAAELNILDGVTASTAELNILDGVTATTDELNYVDGVTSNIQNQLNGKQDKTTCGTQANDMCLLTYDATKGSTAVKIDTIGTWAGAPYTSAQ